MRRGDWGRNSIPRTVERWSWEEEEGRECFLNSWSSNDNEVEGCVKSLLNFLVKLGGSGLILQIQKDLAKMGGPKHPKLWDDLLNCVQ